MNIQSRLMPVRFGQSQPSDSTTKRTEIPAGGFLAANPQLFSELTLDGYFPKKAPPAPSPENARKDLGTIHG